MRGLFCVIALAGCIDAPASGGSGDDTPDAAVAGDAGGGDGQLLLNPGFEDGVGVGWLFAPGGSPRIATGEVLELEPQAGDYAAEVGGTAAQNDTISQEVEVPEGATGLTLSFHRCVLSEEPLDPEEQAWDYCHVRALVDGGTMVLYEETDKDAKATCEWADAAVSVTPFMPGAPIEILLIATNDEDAPTRCLYDTFALVPTFE